MFSCVHTPEGKPGWNHDRFVSALDGHNLVIDDSRSHLINYCERTLQAMVEGTMASANRFRRLLLGRKGIGKTALLKAIGDGCEQAGNVLVCFIDYSSPSKARLPSSILLTKLPKHVKRAFCKLHGKGEPVDPVEWYRDMNEILARFNQSVFFCIDEFQLVYGKECLIGRHIIEEVNVIGGLDGKAVFSVICGSGKHLRALAFCKLDRSLVDEYPNYGSVDLNSTKYGPVYIHPFTKSVEEFRAAMQNLCDKIHPSPAPLSPESEIDLMRFSGGCIGVMDMILKQKNPRQYASSSKGLVGLSQDEKRVLWAIYQIVNIPDSSDQDDPLKCILHQIRLIDIKSVKTLMNGQLNEKVVYNLSDMGIIRYDDGLRDAQVGFSVPLYFEELDDMYVNDYSLRLTELMDLKYHYVDGNKAEPIVLRLLSRQGVKLFGVDLKNGLNDDFSASSEGLPDLLKKDDVDETEILDKLYKEQCDAKDNLGADCVVLHRVAEKKYALHRAQLKMGKKTINEETAQGIVDKFNTNAQRNDSIYRDLEYEIVEQHLYLITTRPYDRKATKIFQDNGITLRDAGFLRDNDVWPTIVQELGDAFRRMKSTSTIVGI